MRALQSQFAAVQQQLDRVSGAIDRNKAVRAANQQREVQHFDDECQLVLVMDEKGKLHNKGGYLADELEDEYGEWVGRMAGLDREPENEHAEDAEDPEAILRRLARGGRSRASKLLQEQRRLMTQGRRSSTKSASQSLLFGTSGPFADLEAASRQGTEPFFKMEESEEADQHKKAPSQAKHNRGATGPPDRPASQYMSFPSSTPLPEFESPRYTSFGFEEVKYEEATQPKTAKRPAVRTPEATPKRSYTFDARERPSQAPRSERRLGVEVNVEALMTARRQRAADVDIMGTVRRLRNQQEEGAAQPEEGNEADGGKDQGNGYDADMDGE